MIPIRIWGPGLRIISRDNIIAFQRKCSDLSIIKTQLEVPTFCDIHVDVACKVRIKPLNVHKYHNLNAFLLQTDQKFGNAIEHYVDGNKIIVKGHDSLDPNTLCSIKAPVKANLNINAGNSVSVGFFQGDKLTINTEGNVFVDRFQGDVIDVSTKGNIILNNHVQASSIVATATNGSIKTGRLQSLNLNLKTVNEGDINVDSSYCSNSIFVVENGNMNLNNVHKYCKIFLNKGNLVLTGFDGELSALINSGSADIHVSRISGNSDITLKDVGGLDLKLSDSCLDSNKFKIASSDVSLLENLKAVITKTGNLVILNPENNADHTVLVNCLKSKVKVETITWQDMIKIKLENK